MVKTILVGEQILDGKKVLDKLRRVKFPILDAFWYQVSDSGAWRLIMASPKVAELGPIGAYTALRDILVKTKTALSLSDFSLRSPRDPEYLRLRKEALGLGRLGVGPASGPIRDIAFSDAYQYALPVKLRPRAH